MSTLLRNPCIRNDSEITLSALTSNPDVRFLALLSSSGAPGDTLTPVLIEAEDLLHLLPGNLNRHLHDRQRCKAGTDRTES